MACLASGLTELQVQTFGSERGRGGNSSPGRKESNCLSTFLLSNRMVEVKLQPTESSMANEKANGGKHQRRSRRVEGARGKGWNFPKLNFPLHFHRRSPHFERSSREFHFKRVATSNFYVGNDEFSLLLPSSASYALLALMLERWRGRQSAGCSATINSNQNHILVTGDCEYKMRLPPLFPSPHGHLRFNAQTHVNGRAICSFTILPCQWGRRRAKKKTKTAHTCLKVKLFLRLLLWRHSSVTAAILLLNYCLPHDDNEIVAQEESVNKKN